MLEAARSGGAWNIVFCQDGDVLMRSHPGEGGGEDLFMDLLRNVRTRAMLGCLDPTPGEDTQYESNALRSMGWIYAQDRETPGFEAVRDRLRHHLPDFLARTMRGKGEAEHLFHLVLAFLYDSGKLSNPDLPATELARGVRNALSMIGEIYPEAGLPAPSMTLVASNCYSAAGYTGSRELPVRIFERPGDVDFEVHRGVGVRRVSGEVPLYPRTGHRALILGPFVEQEHEGSVRSSIASETLFCITRDCEIETHEQ
jgi:hypothetical protein